VETEKKLKRSFESAAARKRTKTKIPFWLTNPYLPLRVLLFLVKIENFTSCFFKSPITKTPLSSKI
jgi:hypothetical protein